MRKFILAVLAMFAAQAGFSSTTVLTEDFEDAAYVVGSWVNTVTPANPLIWDLTYAPSDGSQGTIVVGQPVAAGPKTLFFNDNKSTGDPVPPVLRMGMSDESLTNFNGGTGITKGSVQFDYRYSGNSNHSVFNLRLYDEFPYDGTSRVTANTLVSIWGGPNSAPGMLNAGQISVESRGTTPNPVLIPIDTYVIGQDYRFTIDFDLAADTVTVKFFDLAIAPPAELGSLTIPVVAAPTDGFTGVKGLYMDSNSTNRQPRIHLDNFIFTAEPTGPAPEVAVTVDAADVADGGTVDFGAPAVGVPTSKTFTVSNTGTVDLTTANLVLPAGYALAAGSDLAAIIAPSATDDFIVELDTAAAGDKSGEITFDTNDSDENPFNINVTANVGSTSVEDWTER